MSLITADREIGVVKDLVQNGGRPKENSKVIANLRQNAKLPSSEGTWEQIDDETMRAYEQEAMLIEDIRAQGLTTNISVGDLFSSYRFSSLMDNANVDMSGLGEDAEDRIDYLTRTVPVPVTHKEFRIPWREMENQDVSGDNIAEAVRAVTRALESMAWGGADWKVEGNQIEGLNDVTTDNWDDHGAWSTASNAYKDVIGGIKLLKDNGYSAPFNLYVDNSYMGDLMGLKSNTTKNYVEIIEALPEINAVRFPDNANSDSAYLVSMTRRSIDLALAQWITTTNWDMDNRGRVEKYSTFAVVVPRIKKDYAGNYGITVNDSIGS